MIFAKNNSLSVDSIQLLPTPKFEIYVRYDIHMNIHVYMHEEFLHDVK